MPLTEMKYQQKAGPWRRSRGVALLALLLLGTFLGACRKKPTLDECRTSLANFLRLQLGPSVTPAEINRMVTEEPISVKMTKRCMQIKTRKQVECEMSAPSKEEMRQCARFARDAASE